MKNKIKNKQSGFLQIIIIIIIIIILMSYFHISISGVVNWVSTIIHNVFG